MRQRFLRTVEPQQGCAYPPTLSAYCVLGNGPNCACRSVPGRAIFLRMKTLASSFIREILQVAAQPGTISFAGGLPAPECFPTEELAACFEEVLRRDGAAALQYHTSAGFLPLRDAIAQRMNAAHGTRFTAEEILITTGAQQSLDLISKVVGPGSIAFMESPGYLGAHQVLAGAGIKIDPVDTTGAGIDLDQLRSRTERETAPMGSERLLYTMTRFQNPTGRSYSETALSETEALLRAHDLYAIEDDPYGELYFAEAPPQPLVARAPERTLYLGSFSKSLAPGLRLGWLVAPEPFRTQLVRAKQAADLCTGLLPQKAVLRYLFDYDFEAHLDRIRKRYAFKYDRMREAIAKHLGSFAAAPVGGGMFLWLSLPEGTDEDALFDRATRRGVAYVPGGYLRTAAAGGDAERAGPAAVPAYPDPASGAAAATGGEAAPTGRASASLFAGRAAKERGSPPAARLNFTNPSPELIETGIERIALALEDVRADSVQFAAV